MKPNPQDAARAQRELIEDIGSILAGIGIFLILKRLFFRK
jgi:hypothetical protein